MFAIPIFDTRRFYNVSSADRQLTIATSSCLIGAAVRYDGASKLCAPLQSWPEAHVRLLPICPEVGAGLTVPRPPVQLITTDSGVPRARGRDLKMLDVTAALEQFAQTSVLQLRNESALCGYVWKSRSPSCGFGSTPLFNDHDEPIDVTSGIHARAVNAALPWLVHIEETQLLRPSVAARFILQCRLVLDLRTAIETQPDALSSWHRHYAFLQPLLSVSTRKELQRCVDTSAWEMYLRIFNQTCENVEAEQLLGLFVSPAFTAADS